MAALSRSSLLAAACAVAWCVPAPALAQADSGTLEPIWLARPAYPAIAESARIQGVIDVQVAVGSDGSVQSADASPAVPFLADAALEAARESHFICRSCDGPASARRSYLLVYAFRFADSAPWEAEPGLTITPSRSRLTIVSPPMPMICGLRSRVAVRSAACLYLWKCGSR